MDGARRQAVPVHVGVAAGVGQAASALDAAHLMLGSPEYRKPTSHENVATLSCLSAFDIETMPLVGLLAPVPVHLVTVSTTSARY